MILSRRTALALGAACLSAALPDTGHANAEIVIVALGASNTDGRGRGRYAGGVDRSKAYPAQLEALLRRRGINARVINAGVPGDTTGGMASRFSAVVPAGTRVVILQPGGNDQRRGVAGRGDNIAAIRERTEAMGARFIMLGQLGRIAPQNTRDADGQHFTEAGHAAFANHLLPQVMQAIRRR